MSLDRWVAGYLTPLAIWVLISGLDDLVLDLAFLHRWIWARFGGRATGIPSPGEIARAPRRRIAIFVPLWQEDCVIESMLEHNLAASRYHPADFFVGAYPNDPDTLAAVRRASGRFPNVHLAVCPHPGPTTKADCLNWIFQRMLRYERECHARFDLVVTHDAEDLIHPDALAWLNYFSQRYDMVQIPVLPLPTPFREFTHGVYCDEFAESQTRDLPARNFLGGFVPSVGVGAGFSRAALDRLAAAYSNRIFEPDSLTEDYENGLRVHRLGFPQLFVPILKKPGGAIVATREYFPRTFRAAVRQRTRWVMGIALQSWQRYGWSASPGQLYWLWRDRKGLLGNPLGVLCNLTFLYGCVTWALSAAEGRPWPLAHLAGHGWFPWISSGTMGLYIFHTAVRMAATRRVYGGKFALGVPLRMFWANAINCAATFCALGRFAAARLQGRPLVWLKTDHAYPTGEALQPHQPSQDEIRVSFGFIAQERLESEHLVAGAALALSAQSLPLESPGSPR